MFLFISRSFCYCCNISGRYFPLAVAKSEKGRKIYTEIAHGSHNSGNCQGYGYASSETSLNQRSQTGSVSSPQTCFVCPTVLAHTTLLRNFHLFANAKNQELSHQSGGCGDICTWKGVAGSESSSRDL